jgi:DNA polymerase-3 subunit gamma/tau
MQHKVLALKFRPQSFAHVVGQEHITFALVNSLKTKRVHHAYLFSGPRGVGKTTTARILAKSLNCEKGISPEPCNNCKNCMEITKSVSMDVEEIDGASNRGINEIRELKEKTRYFPLNSKYKIFIIDEVHMLTNEAFNALLKILEEPPDFVMFILATTEPHKIPVTILSRCQRFDFKRIPLKKIVSNFQEILKNENILVPESVLVRVAKKSEGSMRDGLSLLEQIITFYGDRSAEKYIDEILGFTNIDFFNEFMDRILNKDSKGVLSDINGLYFEGVDFKEFARDFIDYVQNLVMLSYFPENKDLIDNTEENIAEMSRIASKGDKFFFETFLNLLIKEFNNIKFSDFPELNIKLLCLKAMQLSSLKSIDEVINQLKNFKAPPAPKHSVTEKTEKIFSWEDFIQYLSGAKPLLYGFLIDSELISMKGDSLIIKINKTVPEQEKFLKNLTAAIKDFFGKTMHVKLEHGNGISFKHEVFQNETINDILRIFNGKIEEIKFFK